MKYGSKEESVVLDDDGSTMTTETNYRGGLMNKPIRLRYNYRIKVVNKEEEYEEYLKFCKDRVADGKLFDINWGYSGWEDREKKGFYYVVKSYTRLEY